MPPLDGFSLRTPWRFLVAVVLWVVVVFALVTPARAEPLPPPPPPREAGLSRAVNVLYLYYRSSDRRFTEALGLYWHRDRDHSATRLVLPVYLDHFNKRSGERFTLVPPVAFSQGPEEVRLRLLPLASFSHGRTAQPRWQLSLWPVLFMGQRGRSNFQLLAPAFAHIWRPAEKHRIVWAAPLLRERRPGRQRDAVLPLFYRDVKEVAGGQRRAFHTPLAGTVRAPGFGSFHVGPFYHSRRERPAGQGRPHQGVDVTTTDAIAPLGLLWRSRSALGEREMTLVSLPLMRVHASRHQRSFMFAPLIFHAHEPARRPGQRVNRQHTVLFPLIWDVQRPDRRRTVAFPLVWHFRKGGASTTVVGNTYVHRVPSERTYNVHVIPFVHVQRRKPAAVATVASDVGPPPRMDLRWSVFGGLIGYERAGRARQLRLFFLPVSLPPLRERLREPPRRG